MTSYRKHAAVASAATTLAVTLCLVFGAPPEMQQELVAAEFVPLGFSVDNNVYIANLRVSEDGSVVVGTDRAGQLGNILIEWTRESGTEVVVGAVPASVSGDGATIVTTQSGRGPIKITENGIEDLPVLPGSDWTRADLISQDGSTVIGRETFNNTISQIRWTDAGISVLPDAHYRAISANGDVLVGEADNRPVRWTEATGLQELPSSPSLSPEPLNVWGMSSDGRWSVGGTTGHDVFRADQRHAVRWDGLSPPQRLPPSDESWGAGALDVTIDGSTVVGAVFLDEESPDPREKFVRVAGIWTEETGMVPLHDLLVTDYGLGDVLDGWMFDTVFDITDDGRFMVGLGRNPSGTLEAFLVDLGGVALLGDYNNNGVVEQADLDLVLLHWGSSAAAVPDTWINDLPEGLVDQEELDAVLLGWGNTAALGTASVPEPSGILLALLVAAGAFSVRGRLR